MTKLTFRNIHFIKSCAKAKNAPHLKEDNAKRKPHIAVAGRSNVGKSSLLNHLFKSKNLVKTSQKPGKTRLLNFFEVDEQAIFCDLPGYGYANVKQDMRSQWSNMIEPYLETHEDLKGVLLLLDIRRTPSDQDIQFYEWVSFHQIPILIVLTKLDKVSKNEMKKQEQKIFQSLGSSDIPHVKYSTIKNIGRKELIGEINRILNLWD